MENLEQYRILRKALDIISNKTEEEIVRMIDLISKGSIEDIIIEEVTKDYKVTLDELKRKSRRREYVEPRQMIMCLLSRNTKMTLKNIGSIFGGRDHSTVVHAVKTVDNLMFFEDYRQRFERIEAKIKLLIDNKSE